MKNRKRFAVLLAAAVTALCACMPTFAATTRTPINSLKVGIRSHIQAGQRLDKEEIDIAIDTNGCAFDSYEVLNESIEWSSGIEPKILITIYADSNHYFNRSPKTGLKASKIKITGGTYVGATIDDHGSTLLLTVTLPRVGFTVEDPENLHIDESLLCTWSPVETASGYEVRFYRESASLGGLHVVNGTEFNGGPLVRKGGGYWFKVRSICAMDNSVLGEWIESEMVTLSDEEAAALYQTVLNNNSAGDWLQEGERWRFRLPDGRILANEWRYIYGEWYYFLDDGFMATGWQQVGDKWFYLDPANGKMWANCDTPDGYHLGIDGSMY